MSVYPIAYNWTRTVKIEKVVDENPKVKTFYFRDKLCLEAKPGQFLMVWIPGVDEIPLSVSGVYSDGLASVTVAKVGEATEAMHKLGQNDLIGVRGPFGNSFKISGKRALLIGGGTGMAPLAFLAEKLAENPCEITFIIGAKSAQELLFLERIKKTLSELKSRIIVMTEDGSFGQRGVATDSLEDLLREEKYDMIYACGPESMIKKVFLAAEEANIPFQASLERIMRCGIGICGSCMLGSYRVCRDGPVFT
ncbi:dihydroorotate dehydrogenase electron transfer subunit, partial [Candidatus Bathyarchaeota archaeon]